MEKEKRQRKMITGGKGNKGGKGGKGRRGGRTIIILLTKIVNKVFPPKILIFVFCIFSTKKKGEKEK